MEYIKIEDFAREYDKSIDDVLNDITRLVKDKTTFCLEEIKNPEQLSFRELLTSILELIEVFKKNNKKMEIITPSIVAGWNSKIVDDFISILKAKKLFDKYAYANINSSEAKKKIRKKSGIISDEQRKELSIQMAVKTIYSAIANYLNDRIIDANQKIDTYYRLIKKDSRNISEIENLILKLPIDQKEVERLINTSYLETKLKDLLISKAREYIKEKNTEYEEKLERERIEKERKAELTKLQKIEEEKIIEDIESNKLFSINNYESIEPIIEKYSDLFPAVLMTINIEELLTSDELKEVLQFNYFDIDDEVFSHAFMTLLARIDKSNNKDNINTLIGYLEILCIKYELYNRVISAHHEIIKVFSLPNLTSEEVEILSNIKNQLLNIYKETNYDNVNKILDKIHLTLYNIKNTNKTMEKKKIEIKAFTLFDYKKEDGANKSYVLTDLDPNSGKNFIDDSLDKNNKLTNSYLDFNELIEDILIYGESKSSLEANDKIDKVIRPVYYSENSHKIIVPKMSNASGIYRIRPRLTSNLRFFEEKIILSPGSEKHKQIIKLLESKLPNSIIDNTCQFIIYINYLDAIKQKETDSYSIAKKRQSSSELRTILKGENDTFTEEELAILNDAIDTTLKTFQELTELNDSFEFNTINHLKSDNHKLN